MSLKTKLRLYQEEAVEKALKHDGFLLIPEQRTGKILITLGIIARLKPEVVFITGVKSATEEWLRQIPEHWEKEENIQIVVRNYEKAGRRRKEYYDWLKQAQRFGQTVMVVVDEAHKIKTRGSTYSRFCRTCARRAHYRLALTGTPLGQGIQDTWALFDFIDPMIMGRWDDFVEKFLVIRTFHKDGATWDKILRVKNEKKFMEIFHKYSYRTTLNEARKSMGKRGIRTRRKIIQCDLVPSAQDIYDELQSELETEVNDTYIEAATVLTLTGKLQQICGGFTKDVDGHIITVGKGKFDPAMELVDQLKKDQFVICCRYKAEMDQLEKLLKAEGLSVTSIRGGRKYRDSFQGKLETDAAVIQIQKSIAIDLARAKHLIFYSSDFSYFNHDQICYRIKSFNTTQANYYYLLMNNTVDYAIYRAVREKRRVADVVCDVYRRNPNARISRKARRTQGKT